VRVKKELRIFTVRIQQSLARKFNIFKRNVAHNQTLLRFFSGIYDAKISRSCSLVLNNYSLELKIQ